VNIAAIASGGGSVTYHGVQNTDTINFADTQANIASATNQTVGGVETTVVAFKSGETATLIGNQTTLNFAGTPVAVSSLPPPPVSPSQANSSIVLTPATQAADGSSSVNVVVTAKDASGNLLTGQVVTLTSTDLATGDHFVQASGITGANGQYSTTLTSTLANATDTISAAIGSPAVTETANENFTTPPPTPTSITVTPASPTAEADGVGQVALTAQVLDQFGHAIGAGDIVTIQQSGNANITAPGGGSTISQATTDASGQVHIVATDTMVQADTITFQTGTASGGTQATFTQPVPVTASLSVNPASAPADGTSTESANVVVQDDHGVGVSGVTVNFSTAGGTSDHLAPASVVTGPSGTATTLISSTTVNPADTVTASEPSAGLTQTATAVFTPLGGVPDSAHSSITVNPTSIVADGSTQGAVQVLVEDSSGTPVANEVVQLSSANPGDTLGADTVLTNSAGIATTTIQSVTPGSDVITAIEPSDGARETANVTFTAPQAPTTLTVSPSSATIIGDGVDQASFQTTVLDAANAPIANSTVTATELVGSGTVNTTAQTNAQGVATFNLTDATPGDNNIVQFTDGTASASAQVSTTQPEPAAGSTLTLSQASAPADGTTQVGVSVHLVDPKGVAVANETVNLTSTNPGDTFAATSLTTDASGNASTTVASTTGAPSDVITATEVNGATQTATENFIAPPAPSATNSTLTSADTQIAADGVQTDTYTLVVKDQNGQIMAGQQVTLASSGTGDHLSATTATTDANGQVTVQLTPGQVGNDTVTATETSNGAQETASVNVTQAESATNSTITLSPSTAVADGHSAIQVSVLVKDVQGNIVPNAQVTVSTPNSGDVFAGMTGNATTITTNSQGIATTSLTSTSPIPSDKITATENFQPSTPTSGPIPSPITVSESANATFTAASMATTINVAPAAGSSLNSVADNVANVVLAATVLDQFGNPVAAGTTVNVTQSGHGTLSGATLTTGAGGVVQETVTDKTAESDIISFTSGTAHGSATAVFAAPVATTINMTASPTSVAGDGHTQSTLAATVLDQAHNPMATAPVSFATTAGTLSTLSTLANASGVATDHIVDNAPNGATATITASDGSIHGTASVTFTATTPQDTGSDMTAAALTTLVEGQHISAAAISGLLGLIAPDATDSLYAVESVINSGTVPNTPFTDAGGHTDNPVFLDITAANTSVNTNNFPALQAIFDTAGGLTVTGTHSVQILGDDGHLLLADTAQDTITMGNQASDSVTMGAGHDTLTFGTGTGDIGIGGSGGLQSMTENGTLATMNFGTGGGQSIILNGANSTAQGGTGAGDTATANATGDTLIAGNGVGDLYKAMTSGITLKDGAHGIATFSGTGGDIFSLGHGELSSVTVAGGNNTVGFALTPGGIVAVNGLQSGDQLNFAAQQSAAHVTNLGNEALVTFGTGAPGEVLALTFASQAAEQAALAHAHWGVAV
jgi:adhesin/invasin